MNRKNTVLVILIAALMVLLISPAQKVSAEDTWIDGVKYDWSETWDANQNNAYIDLMNAVYQMDEEVSLRDDYITSEQLLNVQQRFLQEHGYYWDIVIYKNVSYTKAGYVDTLTLEYAVADGIDRELFKTKMHEMADAAEFGKSFIYDTMTDYEKALVSHDFVAQRSSYIEPETEVFGIAEPILLNNFGVCRNIGRVYESLLNYAQVPFGVCGGHNHEWVGLCIDGKWYSSDATFDVNGDNEDGFNWYLPTNHQYFLCGLNRHYEDNIFCMYKDHDIVNQIEYDDSQEYLTLKDFKGTLAYHANEGESHGRMYYLSTSDQTGSSVLTSRDSMKTDANIVQYEDSIYEGLSWANDTLYGYRDNGIYIIDWNTHEETLIAEKTDGVLSTFDKNGNKTGEKPLKQDEGVFLGLLAENGELSVEISYPDTSFEAVTVCTYDKLSFEPTPLSEKVEISGPSTEPGEFLFNYPNAQTGLFPTVEVKLDKITDKFVHPDGCAFPEMVSGCVLVGIGPELCKDLTPARLGGKLTIPKLYYTIDDSAFENCTGITGELDISSIQLKPRSFRGCTGIEKLIIQINSLVPEYTFAGCTGIREVRNLETAYHIDTSAFEGCSSLSGPLTFVENCWVGDNAFKDCSNVELDPVVKAMHIGESAFENCTNIKGVLSFPNLDSTGKHPFINTGITRIKDLNRVFQIGSALLKGTQIGGILDFPALRYFQDGAFSGDIQITAIRFTCPGTEDVNESLWNYPESTDVALFVVKGSKVESVISRKWTYGVNYWYVDDVIANGELDNGITWSIGADGVMTLGTTDAVTDKVVLSGYSDEPAPWDEYKRFVEFLDVKSEQIQLGSAAICDFINLEEATLVKGCSAAEDAFLNCDYLQEDNIIISTCDHVPEIVPAVEAGCATTGLTEGQVCSICGETLVRQKVVPPLGHDYVETVHEPTCEEEGYTEFKCSRCGDCYWMNSVDPLGHITVKFAAKDATCTESGSVEHWECSRCHKLFSDAGCENEIAQEDIIIGAKGHTEEVIAAVPATCTEPGLSAGKKCSVCDEILEAPVEVDALGHDFGEWTVTQAATCTEKGVETRTCARCEEKETREIAAKGHTDEVIPAVAPTCTEKGSTAGKKCSVCDEILEAPAEVDALGHDWSEWKVTKEATEEEEGLETRTCSRCEETDSRSIPMHDHTHKLVKTEAVEPTCTEEGNIVFWTCSKCGKIYSDADCETEIAEADVVISAKGHTDEVIPAVAPTCTEKGSTAGKKCSVCGEILEAPAEVDALGHDWGEWKVTKEATEEEEGLEARTCSRCEETDSRSIPMLDHTHKLVKTEAVEPTCTEEGNIVFWTCSKCGKIYSDADGETEIAEADVVISAKGHTDEVIPAVAPTCTEKGSTAGKKCSVCGEILEAPAEVDALGHDFGEWTHVSDSSCTEHGYDTRSCSRCSVTENRELDLAEHDWEADYTIDIKATSTTDGSKSIHCKNCNAVKDSEVIPAIGHQNGEQVITDITDTGDPGISDASDTSADETENEKAEAAAVKVGTKKTVSAGTVKVTSTKNKTVAFTKAKNKTSVKVPAAVSIGGKTYKVTSIKADAFKSKRIRTVTVSKNVKTISKNAFKGSGATKVIIKSKLLKKVKVKGCLKGSKVRTVQVKVSTKKSVNKKYVKKYKAYFTKKNAGKKVTVK